MPRKKKELKYKKKRGRRPLKRINLGGSYPVSQGRLGSGAPYFIRKYIDRPVEVQKIVHVNPFTGERSDETPKMDVVNMFDPDYEAPQGSFRPGSGRSVWDQSFDGGRSAWTGRGMTPTEQMTPQRTQRQEWPSNPVGFRTAINQMRETEKQSRAQSERREPPHLNHTFGGKGLKSMDQIWHRRGVDIGIGMHQQGFHGAEPTPMDVDPDEPPPQVFTVPTPRQTHKGRTFDTDIDDVRQLTYQVAPKPAAPKLILPDKSLYEPGHAPGDPERKRSGTRPRLTPISGDVGDPSSHLEDAMRAAPKTRIAPTKRRVEPELQVAPSVQNDWPEPDLPPVPPVGDNVPAHTLTNRAEVDITDEELERLGSKRPIYEVDGRRFPQRHNKGSATRLTKRRLK